MNYYEFSILPEKELLTREKCKLDGIKSRAKCVQPERNKKSRLKPISSEAGNNWIMTKAPILSVGQGHPWHWWRKKSSTHRWHSGRWGSKSKKKWIISVKLIIKSQKSQERLSTGHPDLSPLPNENSMSYSGDGWPRNSQKCIFVVRRDNFSWNIIHWSKHIMFA